MATASPHSPRRRRIVSLGLKLAATTVFLVLIVSTVLAALSLRSFSEDLEAQTERLVRIRTDAIEQVGSSTARYLALPAVGPMYDNDLAALYALILPPVREEGEQDLVYGFIVDAEARLWVAAVDEQYAELHVPGASAEGETRLYRATADEREPELPARVSPALVEALGRAQPAAGQQVERRLVLAGGGGEESRTLLEFVAPIVDRESRTLGWLTLAYSLDELERELAEIRAAGAERQSELRRRMLLLGGLAAVMGCLIAILQALAITRNVKKLSRAANQIARGDLSVRANVRSSDEIGVLGHQFNVMADRVQALLIETEQKAMLERELDIARTIQEQLMPPPGLSEVAGVGVSGYFRSASICGGDFWHRHALGPRDLLLTIGDVTGHGVPSAMISAAAKSGLDTLLNVHAERGAVPLPWLLGELNKTIHDTAQRSLVMTFLAVHVDRARNQLSLASAGHNFPFLVRRQPDGRARAMPLVARGTRLGDARESTFEATQVPIVAGDLLFLYTDGLTEYVGASGTEYGERRLARLLESLAGQSPQVILERVLDDLAGFAGPAPQTDDITLVVAAL